VADFAFRVTIPIKINAADYDLFKATEHSLWLSGEQESLSVGLLLPAALNKMRNAGQTGPLYLAFFRGVFLEQQVNRDGVPYIFKGDFNDARKNAWLIVSISNFPVRVRFGREGSESLFNQRTMGFDGSWLGRALHFVV
jgi:hypothetical protein